MINAFLSGKHKPVMPSAFVGKRLRRRRNTAMFRFGEKKTKKRRENPRRPTVMYTPCALQAWSSAYRTQCLRFNKICPFEIKQISVLGLFFLFTEN